MVTREKTKLNPSLGVGSRITWKNSGSPSPLEVGTILYVSPKGRVIVQWDDGREETIRLRADLLVPIPEVLTRNYVAWIDETGEPRLSPLRTPDSIYPTNLLVVEVSFTRKGSRSHELERVSIHSEKDRPPRALDK